MLRVLRSLVRASVSGAVLASGALGCCWAAAQAPDFRRDILPVLSDSCFACHGPDAAERQAGLRLDLRDEAIAAGAFQPGAADSSPLIERIGSTDPDLHMPPPGSRKDLTEAQRLALRRWIDAGASYEQHWAWQAPERPVVPASGAGWALNPIDHFVAEKLEQQGLLPARRADPRTLLRRISLDLNGLPPTSANGLDSAILESDAEYRAVMERLLESPHYGERMASAWLDVVRYADTVGYHGDQNQNVFPYRDWVVSALKDNMPFDQFVRWQLAGDLIDHPNEQSLTATAFNRLNMVTREGGAQPGEYLAKYDADRVRTVGVALLGITLGCAECHDHKFDPVSTRDFYSMAAFFSDIKQWGVYQDYSYTPNPDLRGWSNDHPFPPELEVTVPALQQRLAKLRSERREFALDQFRAAWNDSGLRAAIEAWLRDLETAVPELVDGWHPVIPAVRATEAKSGDTPSAVVLEPAADGSFGIGDGDRQALELMLTTDQPLIAAVRLEFMGDPESQAGIFADSAATANLQLQLSVLKAEKTDSPDSKPLPVKVHFAEASQKALQYANGFAVDGIRNGWSMQGSFAPGTSGVWVLDEPLRLQSGESLSIRLTGNQARRIRLSTSPFVPEDLRQPLMQIPIAELSPDRVSHLFSDSSPLASAGPDEHAMFVASQWLATGTVSAELRRTGRSFEARIRECRDGKWPVLVTEALPQSRPIRVLPRGNWQDSSGDVVLAATPGFLPPLRTTGDQNGLTRLDLANWLFQEDHPLTARVQMNRLWKHFFGTGLSPSLEDLGVQGQYPSHPELLDWLAVEFRESGWDLKHMVRLIAQSATYQQASRPSAESLQIDPANRWLSHQTPRRLEAEIVRDNALAIAGLLNPEVGGPPAFPLQPAGYYAQLQFPDRDYQASKDSQRYRRGIYMHWQRTFLHPMLASFDAPSREECTGVRLEANTPQQALTLLNDPAFVEAAQALAQRSMQAVPLPGADQSGDRKVAEWMLRTVLFRESSAEESTSLIGFLQTQREFYRSAAEEARKLVAMELTPTDAEPDWTELAARTSLARVLLNLHETITRY